MFICSLYFGLSRNIWVGGRGGQGSTALSDQDFFEIGAQRSDLLFPLSAPVLFEISAQRSDLILVHRSRSSTSMSARFFFFLEIDLQNFVRSEKIRKIVKIRRSALRPILLPALSTPENFSKSLTGQDPLPPAPYIRRAL